MHMKKKKTEIFFYWSLSLTFITLPFPKYSLNSQSLIILLISWLVFNSFLEKIKNLKRNIIPFMIMSSFFWVSIFGLFYTINFDHAKDVLTQNLPFLIIPLVIFSVVIERTTFNQLLKLFSFSVIIASFFGLAKAFYFRINNLGNFFYYTEFSKVLEIHTTYFALFLVISITYFLYDILKTKELNFWMNVGAILYLLFMIYFVSSRISIIVLTLVFVILVIAFRKQLDNTTRWIAFATILLTLFLLGSPNFQKRSKGVSEFGIEMPSVEDRLIHWQAVINTIKKNNLLFGNGTGDGKEGLFEEYLSLGFDIGYKYKYNAHNQFLETILYFGIVGLGMLLSMLYLNAKYAIRNNDFLSITLIVSISIFMFIESVLERHNGIMLFILLGSLIIATNLYPKQNGIKN